jgi:hypothetical protein
VGGTAPLAFGAAFKFDGFEVDSLNFGSATFDASDLTATSAGGADDGRVVLAAVCPDLRLPNTTVWSCGIAVPAPKQASAPAIIKIDLRGDRPRPPVGRGNKFAPGRSGGSPLRCSTSIGPSRRIFEIERSFCQVEGFQQVRRFEQLTGLMCGRHFRLPMRPDRDPDVLSF